MRTLQYQLLAALLLIAVTARSQSSESAYPFTYGIGDISITTLPEVQQQGNSSILIGLTEEMQKKHLPDGTFPNAVNAFLIEASGKSILVDTGFGDKLFTHLEACDKSADDIDIILMTHLHGDHTGGLMKEGKKAFNNASVYLSQAEYDYWMDAKVLNSLQGRAREQFVNTQAILDAYKDKLHLFVPSAIGTTATELLPGITPIAAYGHTPGHTGYMLESYEDRFLIWGDLTHAMQIQMPCPEVAVTYDVDPVTAVKSRQEILKYITENNIKVAGMHIEHPGMAEIKAEPTGGYKFTLVCTCEGILR